MRSTKSRQSFWRLFSFTVADEVVTAGTFLPPMSARYFFLSLTHGDNRAVVTAMTQKLRNYLRMYRKRTGLTQRDVSLLLGCRFSGGVVRYEHFSQEPTLSTSLALAVILRARAHELFAGLHEQAKQDVAARAQKLLDSTDGDADDRRTASLLALVDPDDDYRWEPISLV